MDISNAATKSTYFGLFFIALSVLMYEILLTRIFSVVAYYHFAFMAISIAMFGMTIGAMLVYLLPDYRRNDKIPQQLAFSSQLFSLSTLFTFAILAIPLQFAFTFEGIALTMLVYSLLAIPFIFSGICICLIFVKFISQINKLYAADLFGAGLGCLLIVITLNILSAPTALFFIATLGSIATIFFSKNVNSIGFKRASIFCAILLSFFVGLNIYLEKQQSPFFRFSWVKNQWENKPFYEKWNSFSRVTVAGDPWEWRAPFGWGLSDTTPLKYKSRYLWLRIDASAGTPIINYTNDLHDLGYMKYDVTNIAHYLRPDSNVLVVGVGGGHDVLSALVFNQKSILGVEINPNIVDLLEHQLADYSGNFTKSRGFTLVNDEARSYITRLNKNFDIIQMSLIDTWAATAAGAFALSENSLYTIESWEMLLNHLSPNGILTVTRWYLPNQPAEIYRLATLARQALTNLGVASPDKNIMIITAPTNDYVGDTKLYPATVLISRTAFKQGEVFAVERLAKKFHFIMDFSPLTTSDPLMTRLVTDGNIAAINDQLNLDLTPPTDDKPFFFQMIKLSDIFNIKLWNKNNYFGFNSHAIVTLGVLLLTTLLLTLIFVLLPLIATTKKDDLDGAASFLIYFASIGFGFMFVEISQIQRLTVFLGHPTYGLSVVLFTLLVFTGLGSLLTSQSLGFLHRSIFPLILLVVLLSLFGFFSQHVITNFQMSSTQTRIIVAIAMLAPIALCMGAALPLGMQFANDHSGGLTPWLWGVNGATSICGSVLAICVALAGGISISFWMGVLSYSIALCIYLWIAHKKGLQSLTTRSAHYIL